MTKAKQKRRDFKKLRVLVLVHEDLIPPESMEGYSDKEMQEWKAEYDVVTTLRDMQHEVRPLGVWDDLCRRPPQGQLDDVFGVTRAAPSSTQAGGGDLTAAAALPGLAAGERIDQAKADRAVTATTAKAYGTVAGAPALLVNRFGKGTAVLVNTYVGRYTLCRDEGAAAPWLAFYRWVFETAGLDVDRVAVAAGGQPALGVRRVHHRGGAAEWLGVYKSGLSCEAYPIRIDFTLPEARHVYDVRAGAYLGHVQTFAQPFEAMETRYFSLLPYRVEAVGLELAGKAARGTVLEARAELKTDGAPAGNHAFLVTVTGADGAEIPCFEQRVWAEQGRAAIRLPLAFNEKPGTYTLVVRDVPTGATARERFTLR